MWKTPFFRTSILKLIEEKFKGFPQTDNARQKVAHASIGSQRDPGIDHGEAGCLGRDDEVTGDGKAHPAPAAAPRTAATTIEAIRVILETAEWR